MKNFDTQKGRVKNKPAIAPAQTQKYNPQLCPKLLHVRKSFKAKLNPKTPLS